MTDGQDAEERTRLLEAIKQEQRHRWIQAKFDEPWWHYADALIWIAFRERDVMAERLASADCPGAAIPWYRMDGGHVAFNVTLALRKGQSVASFPPSEPIIAEFKPDAICSDPVAALDAALRQGSATASGCRTGGAVRELIEPLQWQNLDVIPGRQAASARAGPGAHANTIVAYSSAPDSRGQAIWFDVRFEQARLLTAFPAKAVRPRAPLQKPEELKAWLEALRPSRGRPTRREVEAEAKGRGWSVQWARETYPKVADELGFPRRGPGQKPTRP
jgi:hypothetical protein